MHTIYSKMRSSADVSLPTSGGTLESDDRVSRTAEPPLSVSIMAGLKFMRFHPGCYRIPTTNCLFSKRLVLTSGTDSGHLLI